jgi:ABC-type phosphate/phosphonate transport system substrate-binding protein
LAGVTGPPASPGEAPIAALPMYDLPALETANDLLWHALASRLTEAGIKRVPLRLTRGVPVAQLWQHPRLLLAQSCGYPLVAFLGDSVRVVATPRYRAPGCCGSSYRSAIIVRAASAVERLIELRGGRCAVNDPTSNSGMNLLRATIAPLAGGRPFFGAMLHSGSHRRSVAMVGADEADVAAIDCVTFEHLRRTEPLFAAAVRVIAWTVASPGLPLVTARRTDDRTLAAMRAALADIAADSAVAPARATLLIDGFAELSGDSYACVLAFERRAAALGYPNLV